MPRTLTNQESLRFQNSCRSLFRCPRKSGRLWSGMLLRRDQWNLSLDKPCMHSCSCFYFLFGFLTLEFRLDLFFSGILRLAIWTISIGFLIVLILYVSMYSSFLSLAWNLDLEFWTCVAESQFVCLSLIFIHFRSFSLILIHCNPSCSNSCSFVCTQFCSLSFNFVV